MESDHQLQKGHRIEIITVVGETGANSLMRYFGLNGPEKFFGSVHIMSAKVDRPQTYKELYDALLQTFRKDDQSVLAFLCLRDVTGVSANNPELCFRDARVTLLSDGRTFRPLSQALKSHGVSIAN